MVRLEIPEPTAIGVHFVERIELQEPFCLIQSGCWVRHLLIHHTDGVFDLCLFANSSTNLEIPTQLQLPLNSGPGEEDGPWAAGWELRTPQPTTEPT